MSEDFEVTPDEQRTHAARGAAFLEAAAAEVEAHVGQSGWDQRPALFALVRAVRFAQDEPEAAARLGLDTVVSDVLTPVEQGELPEGPLDEVLAHIAWPGTVAGCALSQEILILPPSAHDATAEHDVDLTAAANNPDRREARLVVAVLRDGTSAAMLRLRAVQGSDDDLLTGPDLAPNLVDALVETLAAE